MSEDINVQKVAQLARLKLTAAEESYFGDKFKEILGYVSLLSEVNIEGKTDQRDESNLSIYRTDQTNPSGIAVEDFSDKIENQHFMVPSVIE